MMARTTKPEQAAGLKETLDGLKMVGIAILGGSKRADQKVYAKMVKSAKVTTSGTDVSLSVLVPQADIDVLVAGIK